MYRPKYESALRRAGRRSGYEYRVKSDDPAFEEAILGCNQCAGHDNPTQDSIGWVTPKRPLEIAQEWVGRHRVRATVQRRKVIVTRELGKKTVPQGVWVRSVESIPDEGWRDWKTLWPE